MGEARRRATRRQENPEAAAPRELRWPLPQTVHLAPMEAETWDELLALRVGEGCAAAKRVEIADGVTVRPGKKHPAPAGTVETFEYGAGAWFAIVRYIVGDLRSLHDACVRIANAVDGPVMLVRAAVAAARVEDGSRAVRRTMSFTPAHVKKGKLVPAKPQGLEAADRRVLILDFDKLVNFLGIDPRREPERALACMRALLPPELAEAGHSWQWSNSTATRNADDRLLADGEAPPRLGAHFRFWLNQRTGPTETRDLLRRLDRYVKARLAERGVAFDPDTPIVDNCTATPNQLIYTGRPTFGPGLVDPFPGELRYGLLEAEVEERNTVRVDVLLGQLEPLPTTPYRSLSPEQKAERKEALVAARAAKKAAQAAAPVALAAPGGAVVPADAFLAARHQRAARAVQQERRSRATEGRLNAKLADYAVMAQGAVGELRLVILDQWPDGIPEGSRDFYLHRAAALMHHYLPAADFEREFRLWCRGLVDQAWLDDAWAAGHYGSTAANKHAASDAGVLIEYEGHLVDPRYGYAKQTLLDDLGIDDAKMTRLDLHYLINERRRSEIRRREEGALPIEEYRAARRAGSFEETRPWEAEGISKRTWQRRRAAARANVAHGATDIERRDAPTTRRKKEEGARRAARAFSNVERTAVAAGVSARLLGMGCRQAEVVRGGAWYDAFAARAVPRMTAEEAVAVGGYRVTVYAADEAKGTVAHGATDIERRDAPVARGAAVVPDGGAFDGVDELIDTIVGAWEAVGGPQDLVDDPDG